ncbi:MAG: monovalent cation/H+ antiporter complex subunit F [Anderseniella sp.]|nr:monovalent cation/H+ antiporter complex subunit F [Anderseniella sp.]
MEWVYFGACLGILITMTLAVARGLMGPSIFDRVLAVNMFGTKTVLFLAVVSYLSGRPDFLDLALTYALINFIGVIAVLLFFQSREVRRQAEQEKEAGR